MKMGKMLDVQDTRKLVIFNRGADNELLQTHTLGDIHNTDHRPVRHHLVGFQHQGLFLYK